MSPECGAHFNGEFDIDKLAKSVAQHETCGCTCGIALPYPNPDGVNNCFGIKGSGGRPKNYETQEEAYADFKAIWNRGYGGFPNYQKASKYVGHDGCGWLKDVAAYYNRID